MNAPATRDLTALTQVVDLKRVRWAGRSVATTGFSRAWAALVAGEDVGRVAAREASLALAATTLGAMDPVLLVDAGLTEDEAIAVVRGAAVTAGAAPDLVEAVDTAPPAAGDEPEPTFVALLATAPRAGVTAPDRPRYVLEPSESHAEHSWTVAVLAVLCAESPEARAEAFLCGLAHHLHNAWLPDAGFAGETALGEHLDRVVHRLRERGLSELPDDLAAAARASVVLATHADTPAARAFNAADVLDRVLELRWHERSTVFTVREAVEDYAIVHAGPLQEFGMDVLREWGLAT